MLFFLLTDVKNKKIQKLKLDYTLYVNRQKQERIADVYFSWVNKPTIIWLAGKFFPNL